MSPLISQNNNNMVKITKRSKKFSITKSKAVAASSKGGKKPASGGSTAPSSSSSSFKGGGKKSFNKTAESKKKSKDTDSNDDGEGRNNHNSSSRRVNDFLDESNLGQMDVESFFEKATANLLGDDTPSYDDNDDKEKEDDYNGNYDDDDDSYGSLDDDEGSDDEDIAASEARLKKQLDELSTKDPEFHKYLKDNESSLLEFGTDDYSNDDDDNEDEDLDEDDMDEIANKITEDEIINEQRRTVKELSSNKFLLTPRRLGQLESSAFASNSSSLVASIKGLKRIVAAFGTACRLSDANRQDDRDDDDDNDDDAEKGGATKAGGKKKKKEFQITSPVVFDRLMAVCLLRCHEEFHRHLLIETKVNDDESDDSDDDDENENEDDNFASNEEVKKDVKKSGISAKKSTTSNKDVIPDENKPLHPKTLAKSPNWPALRPVIESFLKLILHLLSEAGKEADLLRFVLSAFTSYIPYLTAYPRLSRPTLRTCIRLWSASLDTSEGHNAVRLQAFLRIRQLAITQPFPLIEDCLKASYLGYARRSKFGTASNVVSILPTLTFMGNCIVELYALDYASAYQHAFVYIRQLVLHLRSAVMKRTPESRAVVCCWQYVHCLKIWVAVLCAACGSSSNKTIGSSGGVGNMASSKLGGGASGKDEEANLLQSLVYPLTEVILGVCRLLPIAQYVPLRLHCVRLLQQLAASTGTFIPTTSLLLGVLDHKEVSMKPLRGDGSKGGKKKKKSVQGLRLPLILKLPKEGTLRTTEQLDGVLKETFVLLNREADLYRYSPGFPEFTFSMIQRLRKFNKEIGNGNWRAFSKGTIELCEKYSAFAVTGRSTLTDAPKDVRRLEALKPANMPGMRERYESAIAKERRLEVATQPVMKVNNDKKVRDYDDSDDENNDTTRKSGVRDTLKRRSGSGDESDKDEDEKKMMEQKLKPKKRKKAAVVNEVDLKNVAALKEQDEVQEGIWSDSESD